MLGRQRVPHGAKGDLELELWRRHGMTDPAPSTVATALVPLRRGDGLIALLLAGVFSLAAASRMYVGSCGQCHDDGVYTVTAKALAEGNGYRLISLPGEP